MSGNIKEALDDKFSKLIQIKFTANIQKLIRDSTRKFEEDVRELEEQCKKDIVARVSRSSDFKWEDGYGVFRIKMKEGRGHGKSKAQAGRTARGDKGTIPEGHEAKG